ncbi:MAG: hypothetical protein EP343_08195 [Deltaproteobacteria bacterium]|nr:MAG: hypothetical protein EP343_08195 [Deltaproteobacteria bacterium]
MKFSLWRVIRAFLLCSLLGTALVACFVPYAPEMRGWRCDKDEDCVGGLKCFGRQCRATCNDDLDCQRALGETCQSSKYCCASVKDEVCNGLDDDCDGDIDEGVDCGTGSCQDGKCQ